MSSEAEAGLAHRDVVKAEYDAEFESPDAGDQALAKIDPTEIMQLLGESPRSRTHKMVLAFRTAIKDRDREIEEMGEREVALKDQAKRSYEHAQQLARERDELQLLVDPEHKTRRDLALTEELSQLRVKLAGLEEHNAKLEQQAKNDPHNVKSWRKAAEEATDENRRLRAHVAALERQLVETARVKEPVVVPAPRTWWRRLWGMS